MTVASRSIALDARLPLLILRGQAQDLGFRLRDGGSTITPTSGTVYLYRESGMSNLYTSGAITPGTTSTYTLGAIPTTEALSADWVAKLVVVYSSITYTFRQRAILVGTLPYPRVDVEDLYGGDGVPELRHPSRLPAGQTSWAPQVSAAWDEILRILTQTGKRPWLAIDDSDLYHIHLLTSLRNACSSVIETTGYFVGKAAELKRMVEDAWTTLTIEYEDASGYAKTAGRPLIPCAPVGRPRW